MLATHPERNMTIRKIIIYPDPVLQKTAAPVTKFDDELKTLTEDLLETMYAFKGIGLAAPQIGELFRIFVMDAEQEENLENGALTDGNPLVFVNPAITETSEEKVLVEEGCLSFPGIFEKVPRHKWVVVSAEDAEGNKFSLRLEGLAAQCAQHEIEHLDGHVLTDNLSRTKRRFIKKSLRKRKKTRGLRYAV